MIRCFPYEMAYIERTRLRYVRLPNILNDGKVTRSGRLTGLVVLYFGEELGWVFLQNGEPLSAARLRDQRREVVPLSWILQRAQVEEERADIAYYAVPPEQLRAMYSTLAPAPLFRAEHVDASKPGSLLGGLHERRYDGVLEIATERATHYLTFEGGVLRHAFLAECPDDEAVDAGLERVFYGAGRGAITASGFRLVEKIPLQAPAALCDLYLKLIAGTIGELSAAIGAAPAAARFRTAAERLKDKHPELRRLVIAEDGAVSGEVLGTAERLTLAMAALVFEALSSASRSDSVDPLELYPRVTRPHFHALQAQGFFKHIPWPAEL